MAKLLKTIEKKVKDALTSEKEKTAQKYIKASLVRMERAKKAYNKLVERHEELMNTDLSKFDVDDWSELKDLLSDFENKYDEDE